MLVFALSCALLILGYVFYGRLTERALRPDPARPTPAYTNMDGVDFVPMSTWRVYLIQLLNIAGVGPVFGPIMGALWGPQVLLWVVFGCILGGAVHDFLVGFMSLRQGGAGIPELVVAHLGKKARQLGTFFTLALLILVATVFVRGPALLLAELLPAKTIGAWLGPAASRFLTSEFAGESAWLLILSFVIYTYYLLATLLPIHVLIGRIYPVFGAVLLVMVGGLGWALMTGSIQAPQFVLSNLHPKGAAAWPFIFITVSCGALSGFHATQSPLMARCLKNERRAKPVFYGAMIVEGLIALIWATAAPGFYGGQARLAAALASGGPGKVVHDVCFSTLGVFGGILAVLGVVILPITSGDTAFRVARLVVADYLHLPQSRALNRYKIVVPMFALSIVLNFVDFSLIWRYFGWANQSLATVALWTGAVFLAKRGKFWWLAAFPATFMTVVCVSYILIEDYGLALPPAVGTIIGVVAGLALLACFLLFTRRIARSKSSAAAASEVRGSGARETERETVS